MGSVQFDMTRLKHASRRVAAPKAWATAGTANRAAPHLRQCTRMCAIMTCRYLPHGFPLCRWRLPLSASTHPGCPLSRWRRLSPSSCRSVVVCETLAARVGGGLAAAVDGTIPGCPLHRVPVVMFSALQGSTLLFGAVLSLVLTRKLGAR